MYFKFGESVFTIKETTLQFYFSDETEASRWTNHQPGLFLASSVYTKANEFDDECMAPWLCHNHGIKIDIHHWTELEGKQWIFNDEYDENHNEAGFFGITEGEPLKKCNFEVVKRDGRKFTIRWNGMGCMFWDNDEEMPFDCEFVAEFQGIRIMQCVADQSEDGLRETLGKIIDLDDFKLITPPNTELKEFIFK